MNYAESLRLPRFVRVVGSLKAATSRTMKREYKKELKEFYWSDVPFWSGSYYVASTGGAPIKKLRQYLASQDAPPHPQRSGVRTAAHSFNHDDMIGGAGIAAYRQHEGLLN